jgi:hypothetical protein
MVAADVSSRLFDKNYRGTFVQRTDGPKIVALVRYNVHVLHSTEDRALQARVWANWFQAALGLKGYKEKRILASQRKTLSERVQ